MEISAAEYSIEDIELETIHNRNAWDNMNLRYSTSIDKFDSYIVSFDVSEKGELAVAFNNNKIVIFDTDCKPIGMMKTSIVGTYYIFWKESNLCIYLSRGDCIIEVTSEGKLVSSKRVIDSAESNRFINYLPRRNNYIVGNYKYTASRNIGFLNIFMPYKTYSKIERINVNSEEMVTIVDTGKSVGQKVGVILAIVILMIVIVFGTIFTSIIIGLVRTKKGVLPDRKYNDWDF